MQGLGLACLLLSIALLGVPLFALVAFVVGLGLLFAGFFAARFYQCSECGTKLSGRKLTICPACRQQFTP